MIVLTTHTVIMKKNGEITKTTMFMIIGETGLNSITAGWSVWSGP